MTTLVLGGPGCGKTTELLRIIDSFLAKGVKPQRIGYVTFTRKAAYEGLERAQEKFDLSEDDLPYFRTLHSLAFKQLGLQPESVIDDALMKQFASYAGLVLSDGAEKADDVGLGFALRTDDDRALAAIALARLTEKPLSHVCEDLTVSFRHANSIARTYAEFKEERAVVDFTDMLEEYALENAPTPDLDVLIVDEAQDLCRIQWRIVERLAARADHVFIAGDDDQAIYEWAGADVEYFLSIKGKQRVLPISYRLNQNVFDVCQSIVHRINHRFPKKWKPSKPGGLVERVVGIEDVNLTDGSWYLLARNAFLLRRAKGFLRQQGFPYIDGHQSSVNNDEVRAVLYWEKLRRGDAIPGPEVTKVYQRLRPGMVRRGFKKTHFDGGEYTLPELMADYGLEAVGDWMHVLSLTPRQLDYIREIKRRGESLVKKPRITLSTVHGVKGGEADHVLLMTDVSGATYDHFLRTPDAEARVFYVGASRARESLHIVNPTTTKAYPIGDDYV